MTDESAFSGNLGETGSYATNWQDHIAAVEADNVALREQLRVLTEAARAAADAILNLSNDEAIEDALSSAGHPEAAIEAALRGVLDDHPRAEPEITFVVKAPGECPRCDALRAGGSV